MPPKRPPWADETDALPGGSPTPPAVAAVAGMRRPGEAPFAVFLRAYLNGIPDPAVSRESMRCIQGVLQQHPRTSTVLRGSFLWHVIFYLDFNPAIKATHVIAYLVAVHNGLLLDTHRALWLQLLQLECLVDFPFPILWSVMRPDRQLPPTRKP